MKMLTRMTSGIANIHIKKSVTTDLAICSHCDSLGSIIAEANRTGTATRYKRLVGIVSKGARHFGQENICPRL
jgi:hypothetical protein